MAVVSEQVDGRVAMSADKTYICRGLGIRLLVFLEFRLPGLRKAMQQIDVHHSDVDARQESDEGSWTFMASSYFIGIHAKTASSSSISGYPSVSSQVRVASSSYIKRSGSLLLLLEACIFFARSAAGHPEDRG